MILEFLRIILAPLRYFWPYKPEEKITAVVTAEVTDSPYEDAWEKAEPWKTFPCSSVEEAASLNSQLTQTLGMSLVSRYDEDTKELDVRVFDKELMK